VKGAIAVFTREPHRLPVLTQARYFSVLPGIPLLNGPYVQIIQQQMLGQVGAGSLQAEQFEIFTRHFDPLA
jgi:hypothetical protein